LNELVLYKPFKKLLSEKTKKSKDERGKYNMNDKQPLKCQHCGIKSIFENKNKLLLHVEICDMQLVQCKNEEECAGCDILTLQITNINL
jgi:hypothetical protein